MSITDIRVKKVLDYEENLARILHKLIYKDELISNKDGVYVVPLKNKKLIMNLKEFKGLDKNIQQELRELDLVTIPIDGLDYFDLENLIKDKFKG